MHLPLIITKIVVLAIEHADLKFDPFHKTSYEIVFIVYQQMKWFVRAVFHNQQIFFGK